MSSTALSSLGTSTDVSSTISIISTTIDSTANTTDISANGTAYTSRHNGSSKIPWLDLCKYSLCEHRQENNTLYPLCKQMFTDIVRLVEFEESISETMPHESKVLISLLFVLIMFLSFCGNTLVILTFIFNKHMRSVTNVFILSLAVSDLMVTSALIPVNMVTTLQPYWVFKRFGCMVIPCINSFSVACSSLTLCCIAFDRYYAIVHPLKLKFLQTLRRVTMLQIVVWITAIVASVPSALSYDTLELSTCAQYRENKDIHEVCIVPATRTETHRVYVWVIFGVLFLGPFLFMSAVYTVICHKLWIQRPIGLGARTYDTRLKLKKRAIKMLITVVFIFVVCWSPVLLFNVIAQESNTSANTMTRNLRAYLQCLSVSSTCWNPLVYAFMNEKFRSAFRNLITCFKSSAPSTVARNNPMRMSTESKKTTSQLEMPNIGNGSRQTSETKA